MEVLQSGVSRRQAIRMLGLTGLAALAAACSPAAPAPSAPAVQPTAAPNPTTAAPAAPAAAAAPANAPAGAIAQADWDKLVAAAKQEGTLAIATYAGTAYRRFLDVFESAHGITADHSQFQSSSRDFAPSLLPELKAGVHTWPVALM